LTKVSRLLFEESSSGLVLAHCGSAAAGSSHTGWAPFSAAYNAFVFQVFKFCFACKHVNFHNRKREWLTPVCKGSYSSCDTQVWNQGMEWAAAAVVAQQGRKSHTKVVPIFALPPLVLTTILARQHQVYSCKCLVATAYLIYSPACQVPDTQAASLKK
jgi:hypothetical protein